MLLTENVHLVALAVAFFAGLMRGFSGFGGPALMLAILSWFFTPLVVVGKILIIEVIAASYLVNQVRGEVKWRTTLAVAIPTMITMPLGHWILEHADPLLMRRMIAGVTLLSCAAMMVGFRYQNKLGTFGLVFLGLGAGVVFGASYIALVVVAVLLLGPYEKNELRSLLISWGFLISMWFFAISVGKGITNLESIVDALPMLLVYFIGIWIGSKLFSKSAENLYRRIALVTLMVLSLFSLLS